MSTFAVTLEKVGALGPIEGADRIERATLAGMDYSFVVRKGEFNIGDEGYYFPVDSVFNDEKLLEFLGLTGKLAGGKKNRIKTCKLRGQISQGLLIPKAKIDEYADNLIAGGKSRVSEAGEALTLAAYIGITKYDPEADGKGRSADAKGGLPSFLSKYDIESAQRYKTVLEQPAYAEGIVVITEKIEGQNLAAGSYQNDDGHQNFVCSRSLELKEVNEFGATNNWWTNAKAHNLHTHSTYLNGIYESPATIYGESCGPGIQGDYYKFGMLKFFSFDIKIGDFWVNPIERIEFCKRHDIPHVPVLFIGKLSDFLNGKTVVEAAHGKSALNPEKLREGIVITPVDRVPPRVERNLKIRCPIYLAETGAE